VHGPLNVKFGMYVCIYSYTGKMTTSQCEEGVKVNVIEQYVN